MDDALRSAGWICIAAICGAYATYLVAGSAFNAKESGVVLPIVVRDHVVNDEHHLSGMLMVQSTCEQLSLVVAKVEEEVYQLTFATWTEPAVKCAKQASARVFNTVVFDPSEKARFVATLDGKPLDMAVYQTKSRQP